MRKFSLKFVINREILCFWVTVGPWKACKSKKDQIYHKRIDSEKKRHGKFNNNIREQIGPETFRKLLPFPGDNDNNSPIIFHNSIPYSDSDTNKKPKKRLQPSINEFIVRWNGKKRPRNLLFFDPKSFDDGKINPKTKVKRKRRRLERLCPAEKYETRKSALDRCELLKSDLFSTCHAAVNVRHYYRYENYVIFLPYRQRVIFLSFFVRKCCAFDVK